MLPDKDIKNILELKTVSVDNHKTRFFYQKIIEVLKNR